MSKYIVSGSHGFVGESLVKDLKLKGHTVRRIPHAHYTARFPAFDYFIHLSAYGNRIDQTNHREMINANILQLQWYLLILIKSKFKAFINFSSSSVSLPVQSMYSITKGCGEIICEYYAQKYDMPIVTLRPYTIYGPGDENHLIPTLFEATRTNKAVDIVKEPHHDYVYISDVLAAIHAATNHANKLKGQVLDVGSGISYSNLHIFNKIQALTKKKINVKYVKKMREYDTKKWRANPVKLMKLGWRQKVTIDQGLKNIYAEFRT